MSKWVEATFRKPREGVMVLCTDGIRSWIGYYVSRRNSSDYLDQGWYESSTASLKEIVTYWQSLPKIPKRIQG